MRAIILALTLIAFTGSASAAPSEREIAAGVAYLRAQADASRYGAFISDAQLREWVIGVLYIAERARIRPRAQ